LSKLENINAEVTSVEHGENSVTLGLYIPPTLDYFNGHFPQAPILAGVVQLDWAVKYAREYLALGAVSVKNIEALKFKVVMTPGLSLTLELCRKSDSKFTFSYQSVRGLHAVGRVVIQPS